MKKTEDIMDKMIKNIAIEKLEIEAILKNLTKKENIRQGYMFIHQNSIIKI